MPPLWPDWLDAFDDANLYQTGWYGEVRKGRGALHYLVGLQGTVPVVMMQLRIVSMKWPRCGIAHARGGPVLQRKGQLVDPALLAQFAGFIEEQYVRQRGLCVNIIPNAAIGTSRAEAIRTAFAQFGSSALGSSETSRTFVLDLAPSLDDLRRNLDQKWRNCLNRAEKNGLTVVQGTSAAEFSTFQGLYDQMLSRKRFQTDTKIDEFRTLQEHLPSRQKMRVFICMEKGIPVAGLIGAALGNSGIYLHGATGDRGLQAKGAYLLQWAMVEWLKENGFRYYDLGGIDSVRNPGVFHFKRGLSGTEVELLRPLALSRNPLSTALFRLASAAKGGFIWRVLRRG